MEITYVFGQIKVKLTLLIEIISDKYKQTYQFSYWCSISCNNSGGKQTWQQLRTEHKNIIQSGLYLLCLHYSRSVWTECFVKMY